MRDIYRTDHFLKCHCIDIHVNCPAGSTREPIVNWEFVLNWERHFSLVNHSELGNLFFTLELFFSRNLTYSFRLKISSMLCGEHDVATCCRSMATKSPNAPIAGGSGESLSNSLPFHFPLFSNKPPIFVGTKHCSLFYAGGFDCRINARPAMLSTCTKGKSRRER